MKYLKIENTFAIISLSKSIQRSGYKGQDKHDILITTHIDGRQCENIL